MFKLSLRQFELRNLTCKRLTDEVMALLCIRIRAHVLESCLAVTVTSSKSAGMHSSLRARLTCDKLKMA